jgi:acyl-coenzyme A synthetase/AMP-(fatty) acid ligase/acyl carrier protein
VTRITANSLWDRVCSGGRSEFMVTPGQRFTYADMEQGVRRWLHFFDATGLRSGDRMVIRTRHEPAMVSSFIAALLDGIVPVLLAADTPDLRVQAIHAKVNAACLVLDERAAGQSLSQAATVQLAEAGPAKRGLFRRAETADAFSRLRLGPATRAPRLPSGRSELGYILFTSGTTASPSGVMISQGNLFANLETLTRLFGYQQQSRIFNDMLLAHADGMVQGPLLALANGCAVIRADGFTIPTAEEWLNRIRAERATHVITVPTVWAMIDAYARFDDYFDAPECRLLLSVAAKLPDELWRRLEKRFGRPVCNQYGLTETVASALYAGPLAEMGGFGTIGLPVDCEARIDPVSTDRREGELQLRGENIFSGYWQDEERTKSTFTTDGWLKTGDLVRQRADGPFEYLGRLKSVIMMGGFLIRPDEIDEAMLAHPAVRESVTVAIQDEMFGEVPVTGVVCSEPVGENDLTGHARMWLEARKVPKRIIALAEIPRGLSGKPTLAQLTAVLMAAVGPHARVGEGEPVLDDAVLSIAARVFRVAADQLTLDSGVGDVPGWDSFSHLNFLFEIETHFSVSISAARFAAIRSIRDMTRAVRESRT